MWAAAVLLSARSAPADVSVIDNGDLESGAGTTFASWSNSNAVGLEHSGLDVGSTRAVYLVTQDPNSGVSTDVFAQNVNTAGFDFTVDILFAAELSHSGNALQMILRTGNSAGDLNVTVQSNGSVGLRNSSVFEIVFPAGSVAASVDSGTDNDFSDPGDTLNVYRLRLEAHDYGTTSVSYDLYLSDANVLDGTFALSAPDQTVWQGAAPTLPSQASVTQIRFQAGYSKNDYVVDNISFTIPEPASASLLVLAGLGIWLRRRR